MNNKINTFRIIILATGMIAGIVSAYAQTDDSTKIIRKAQATFVHPLGSNGTEASKVVNNFSFNILYGVSGGVNGAEIGGLINIGYGDVKGFQLAGLGNSATGWVNGFQGAGLYNVVMNDVKGFQVSGITNINSKSVNGAGIAGLANITKGNTKGFLLAGLSNINLRDNKGAYFAGLANIMNGNNQGAQFSGLANINSGEMNGAQFAGLANVTVKTMHGAQVAGLVNVAAENAQTQIAGLTNISAKQSSGLQLAGLANIAPNDHRGSQIAGLANYTKKLDGFQLALINVADTIKRGVPIGFVSVVRHGYRRFELEGNEVLYANLNFKTGTTKFYNTFSVGYRFQGEKQYWGITYGFGTLVPISNRINFNFDLTATHINEDEAWTNELNLLNRLKFNLAYRITNRLEIIGGPSFNVAVSNLQNSEGEVTGSSIIPSYNFYDEIISGTSVKMYAGFNIGLRF